MESNAVIQVKADFELRMKEPGIPEDMKYEWRNWPAWVVRVGSQQELSMLKTGRIEEGIYKRQLSQQELRKVRQDLQGFFEFVYRTWNSKAADAWLGGEYHRASEAFAARLMYAAHRQGTQVIKLNHRPPDLEAKFAMFCKVHGI